MTTPTTITVPTPSLSGAAIATLHAAWSVACLRASQCEAAFDRVEALRSTAVNFWRMTPTATNAEAVLEHSAAAERAFAVWVAAAGSGQAAWDAYRAAATGTEAAQP